MSRFPYISEWIGVQASDTRVDALPTDLTAHLSMQVADCIGVALRQSTSPYAAALASSTVDRLVDTSRASLIGLGAYGDAEAAAFVNGALIHGAEFDDTYPPGRWHGDAVVIPTVLALCEEADLSGAEFLRALTIGLEFGCRLTKAYPDMLAAGHHSTSVTGVVAGALGGAIALGLSPVEISDAVGIACLFASGASKFLGTGGLTVKRLQAGHAARDAICAVRLAVHGFKGPADAFEGPNGYFARFGCQGAIEPETVLDDWGERWEALQIAPKTFPCDHLAQGYLYSVRDVLRHERLQADEVTEVVCYMDPKAIRVMFEPEEIRYAPPSPEAAMWSMPFNVASLLMDGDLTVESYSSARVTDARMHELMRRVRALPAELDGFPDRYPSRVRIRVADGRDHLIDRPTAPGCDGERLTESEYVDKFAQNVRQLDADAARDLFTRIADVQSVPRIRELADLLRSVSPTTDDRAQHASQHG